MGLTHFCRKRHGNFILNYIVPPHGGGMEITMNRAELKAKAKERIKGKIGILFVITLIIGAISAVSGCLLGLVPGGGLVATIVITPAFALSTARVYLMVSRGGNPAANDAFSGFDDFFSAFKVTLLTGLYIFFWSLLFLIPGIVKSYAYSMSLYILAENKGKSARECIKESMAMTDGHKMDLFVLDLSFIGWIYLGVLTLGIAYIWIIPYYNATRVNAYQSFKPVVEVPFEAAEAHETGDPIENTEDFVIEDLPTDSTVETKNISEE